MQPLSPEALDRFVDEGVVRLDGAFSDAIAARCRDLLWSLSGCDPHDPATWTRPVVRLGELAGPLRDAADTPVLRAAYDQLVGAGRWIPRGSLGTFVLRFPSPVAPDDIGWHVDVSFDHDVYPEDFLRWRANVRSRGRALLMLFLFSDVGEDDAPTRIRLGSHRDVARQLAPHGDAGLTLGELAADGFAASAHRPEALAVGHPGTVWLCHPFVVHAGQAHRGRIPRFLAQPPLLPRGEWSLDRPEAPVEVAVARALEEPPPASRTAR